ncbi:hypothetical protein G8C15_10710 [Enterococcus casseliflavus]|nr:hypothetical protein [Enterococcus casseliflavus]
MKFFKRLLALLIPVLVLFCNAPEGEALSFSEAPTLADYLEERGDSKLAYVLGAIARLHFGATARDWDELEQQGTKMMQGLSLESIAEFIFVNTYQYKLTKTAFQLITESLQEEIQIEDKDYFDLSGAYKPLNARNILIRRGAFIDVANLFGARAIMTTTQPYEKGYNFSNNYLYVNEIEMQVNSAAMGLGNRIFDFQVVSSVNGTSGRTIPFIGAIQNIFHYKYVAAGMSQDFSFFRVDPEYSESLSELRLLTGMSVTITIGDMKRVIHGTGTIKGELEIDRIITIDPNDPVVEVEEEEEEEADDGDSWWERLIKWLLEKLLNPLFEFFDWIKEFFVPDFSGISARFESFVDKLTEKFSGIGEIMSVFSGFFVSEKSLHDLTVVWLDGKEYAVFPREYTAVFFVNLRRGVNVLVFMMTGIYIWKKVTGEGDAIAT